MSEPKAIEGLHDLLCEQFKNRLTKGEDHVSKDGTVIKINPSAATLRELRQFLADNDINADSKPGTPLGNLAEAAGLPFPVQSK